MRCCRGPEPLSVPRAMAEVAAGAGRTLAGPSWSDRETGVTEEAAFIGPSGQQILAFLHRPASRQVKGGVLLCGSLYEDFVVNYRPELLVARALARLGHATVRFHYRGMGNSDDLAGGRISFDSMVADARTAESWLVERTQATRLTVVGDRLGAFVATDLAGRDDRTPLVLWSPIVDGAAFFRGMSRASRLAGVRAEARDRPDRLVPAGAGGGSAADGTVEMLGNLVHAATRQDLESRSLPASLGSGRPVLLVSLGVGESHNPRYDELVSGWMSQGAPVEVLRVQMRQLWMVPDKWEPVEEKPTTRALVDGIVRWIDTAGRAPS